LPPHRAQVLSQIDAPLPRFDRATLEIEQYLYFPWLENRTPRPALEDLRDQPVETVQGDFLLEWVAFGAHTGLIGGFGTRRRKKKMRARP
jgi:hypothetical protein